MLTRTHSLAGVVIGWLLPPVLAIPLAIASHIGMDKFSGSKGKFYPLDDIFMHVGLFVMAWYLQSWIIFSCILCANLPDIIDKIFLKKSICHIPWKRTVLQLPEQTLLECILMGIIVWKLLIVMP